MADAMGEMAGKFIKNLYPLDNDQGGRYKKAFDLLAEKPARLTVRLGAETWPMISDLGCKILRNRTTVEFVTSDNPVILFNQLFSFERSQSNTGLIVKGLQIFFPIDPGKVFLFYDVGAYSIGRQSCETVDVCDLHEVNQINMLQMCGCQHNVYFRDACLDLEALHQRALQYRRQSMTRLDVYHAQKTARGSKELFASSLNDVRTNLSLSSVRITRRAKRWRMRFLRQRRRPALVVRSQWMHDEHEKYRNKIARKEVTPYWLFQHLCASCREGTKSNENTSIGRRLR